MKWLVDVDVRGFYDNIDHKILVGLLEQKIDDKRFIKLIKGLLAAGYVEDWRFHRTYSGTPQGGVMTAPTQSRTSSSSGWFRVRRGGVGREV